jgi:ethanolamine ammonia-lyase small subunit
MTASDHSLNPTPTQSAIEHNPRAPEDRQLSGRLRGLTSARVGLRRTGISIATSELLDFQLAHARARDAVHAKMQPASLLTDLRGLLNPIQGPHEALLLHSAAADRQTYLQRPDMGRKLNAASLQRLQDVPHPTPDFDLAIVIADGLSALAVERHAVQLLAEFLPKLAEAPTRLRIAPICVIEQGRVAVADEVAHALSASLAAILIGERPGLSSPDSLGVYITWQPQPGVTTDADRNCISNIRAEGLSYAHAAARLLHYIREARSRQLTGVALKDPDTTDRAMEDTRAANQIQA